MKFIVPLFCLFALKSLSQQTYFIKDKVSSQTIPFVKVKPQNKPAILADIDGSFSANPTEVASVRLSSFGYKDTTVVLADVVDNEIVLSMVIQTIEEVRVVAGENPAHRIMDQVIANRKKNNPLDNDAFIYESYSKYIFDLNPEALASISDTTTDSTLIRIRQHNSDKHVFLMESTSTRTFVPPSRDKEEITAYKVSGFSHPLFSTFARETQSFSFYENQFELMGKAYINPIAFGGTRRYLFILEDTLVSGVDTTFTIFYRPRLGKNFDGLQGRLYINTNGYAVEKVVASPYDTLSAGGFKIIQEYVLMNNTKWFPSKLSTEMEFTNIILETKVKDLYLQGKGSTYIKKVIINPDGIKRFSFNNAAVTTANNANKKDEKDWDSSRVYQITDKELQTYETLDSISKEENLDLKLKLAMTLISGKIPMGYFNLDLKRLLDYRIYEGTRVGLGIETSDKLTERATVGGYFGYGFRDKSWKYGGFSDIHLYKPKSIKLSLVYQQDIIERGGHTYQNDAFSLMNPTLLQRIYVKNMERQQLAEVALSGLLTSNFKVLLSGNYQRVNFTDYYRFFVAPSKTFLDQVDLAETSLEVIWNIREKVAILGDARISKGTKFPKIQFKATRGWKGWANSEFDYWRLNFEINQDVSILGLGKFNWSIKGGQSTRELPLFLSQVAVGTGGKNWYLSVPNSFESMAASRFYNDRQIALFTRFTFLGLKTKYKFFNPQFAIHHAIGFGEMSTKSIHNVSVQSMDKGYYEGGLIIQRILVSGTVGFGVGAFYNYGPYSLPEVKDNVTVKLSFTYSIN
jgi:hypothetical protein